MTSPLITKESFVLGIRLASVSLVALAGVLSGCPPAGPNVPCPPCTYKVGTGLLAGRMEGSFDYPFTDLVVTLKTTGGVSHPFAITDPSIFKDGDTLRITVTTTLTDGIQNVSATWKDANGVLVGQDIPKL